MPTQQRWKRSYHAVLQLSSDVSISLCTSSTAVPKRGCERVSINTARMSGHLHALNDKSVRNRSFSSLSACLGLPEKHGRSSLPATAICSRNSQGECTSNGCSKLSLIPHTIQPSSFLSLLSPHLNKCSDLLLIFTCSEECLHTQ
jgi:hypothetical protein